MVSLGLRQRVSVVTFGDFNIFNHEMAIACIVNKSISVHTNGVESFFNASSNFTSVGSSITQSQGHCFVGLTRLNHGRNVVVGNIAYFYVYSIPFRDVQFYRQCFWQGYIVIPTYFAYGIRHFLQPGVVRKRTISHTNTLIQYHVNSRCFCIGRNISSQGINIASIRSRTL